MATIVKIQKFLSGKKTYLGMIAAGVLGILWSYGLVDDKLASVLASLIFTWTGVSYRAAIDKNGNGK